MGTTGTMVNSQGKVVATKTNPQLARVLRSGLALFICTRSLTGLSNEIESKDTCSDLLGKDDCFLII